MASLTRNGMSLKVVANERIKIMVENSNNLSFKI